jgi:hypothetical protein
MCGSEARVGQSLCLVEKGREFRRLRAQLIGDATPLCRRGFGIVLCKCSGDEGGDDASTAHAGISQRVAHEVDAAALPRGIENLADGSL